MSTQSFPPKSALGVLRTFRVWAGVQLDKSVPAGAVDEVVLQTMISRKLSDKGFAVVETGPCSARLELTVMVVETAQNCGIPLGYCFTVHLRVVTTVQGHPQEDLFMIYETLDLSLCTPVALNARIIKASTAQAEKFADAVISARN